MPTVQITLAEGRTPEQKRAVAKRVTDVLVEELQVPPETIMVFIYELGRDHIARGGVLLSDT
ncbi:MAG TPA: 2-hydroxymuconate tautomerase [Methanospirillum sp.]|nr:2-hydroxymuconate tautomerase [Methanospirillum sp.]